MTAANDDDDAVARERWLEANERHLRAALAWLRANLERLAEPARAARSAVPAVPVPQEPAARRFHLPFLSRRGSVVAVPPPERPAVAGVVLVPRADAPLPPSEAMRALEDGAPRPALTELAAQLGLTRFETHTLLLAAAPELDTGFAALCAAAQFDPASPPRPYPTFALALAALPEPGWEALLPTRPLRLLRLIEVQEPPGGGALVQSAIRAEERVLHLLKGWNEPDPRLLALTVREAPEPLPLSQAELVEALAAAAGPPVLIGGDAPSRRQVAAALVARRGGGPLMRLPAERVPAGTAELEALARLVEREARLLPSLALLLELPDGEPPPAALELARRLAQAGGGAAGALLLSAPAPVAGLEGSAMPVVVARPTAAEQRALWAAALGEEDSADAAALAAQFDLDAGSIRRLGEVVAARAAVQDSTPPAARAWAAALAATRPALDRLAQVQMPVATLADLVLPDATMALLRRIGEQVRHRATVYEAWDFAAQGPRGLGISALFAGESGTGKTMAAEALASALGLPLCRIDLAGVVSKYIGETEKNLKALFDAAERGGAVLFFDEADALFGRRSEVKDAHDRYANIEIDYLLQRMEAYRGLAILATNQKGALDPAFLRRLRFVVDFPFPGVAERTRLWARAFPPGVPVAGLEPALLARLTLTGGSIRNIALNAAFLAAARGMDVTMPIVMEAVRTELEKLERPASEGDLLQPRARGGAR